MASSSRSITTSSTKVPSQTLLRPRAGRRRVPDRGKILRQFHQCCAIDHGTRRPLGVQPDEALLDLLDTLERAVPPCLQLPRDKPLGGTDQLVAASRERGFVLGLLKLAFDGAPAFDRRPVDLLGRLQRRSTACEETASRMRATTARSIRNPPMPMHRPGSFELPGTGSGRDDPTDPGRTPASCVRSARSAPDRSTGPGRPGPTCARRASSCARSQQRPLVLFEALPRYVAFVIVAQ